MRFCPYTVAGAESYAPVSVLHNEKTNALAFLSIFCFSHFVILNVSGGNFGLGRSGFCYIVPSSFIRF